MSQPLGTSGFLVGAVGERSDHQLSVNASLEGDRRLTFMTLDDDIVAGSLASLWRVLQQADCCHDRWVSRRARGQASSSRWCRRSTGTSVFPRSSCQARSISCRACWMDAVVFLLRWDLRESMKEADIEMILQRAKEKYPEARPRKQLTFGVTGSRDRVHLLAIPSATPASVRWTRRAGRESRQRSVQPG